MLASFNEYSQKLPFFQKSILKPPFLSKKQSFQPPNLATGLEGSEQNQILVHPI
jgi:hypothetical protein